jgi:hypothetical protein
VADGDGDEFDASQVSLEGAKEGVLFLGLLNAFVTTAEVPAYNTPRA